MDEENELNSQKHIDQEATDSGQPHDRHDSKKNDNKGDEESEKSVPFYKLFSFVDYTDVALMIVRTVGAIGNGVYMHLMTIIFGQIINIFGASVDIKEAVQEISKVCLSYVYLGAGAGVSCWMIIGERQAARIRSLYLKIILRHDISFFDQETNTREVVGRMSGDTVLIQDAMGEKVGKFIQLVAMFIGAFVIAFIKGWLLALVMLSSIPLLVISGAVMSIFISKMSRHRQAAYSEAGIVVEQTIVSIRTVGNFSNVKNMYKHR